MLGFGSVLQIKKTCQSFPVLGIIQHTGAGWSLCGEPALTSGFPYLQAQFAAHRHSLPQCFILQMLCLCLIRHPISGSILLHLLHNFHSRSWLLIWPIRGHSLLCLGILTLSPTWTNVLIMYLQPFPPSSTRDSGCPRVSLVLMGSTTSWFLPGRLLPSHSKFFPVWLKD